MITTEKTNSLEPSIYALAEPLALSCSFIHPFVTLRREAKIAILDLAKKNDELKKKTFHEIEKYFEEYCNHSDENNEGSCSISSDTLQSFREYFDILSLPKRSPEIRNTCMTHWKKFDKLVALEDYWLDFLGREKNEDVYVHYIDDEHTLPEHNCELTYAVIVNDKDKHIIVVFRGSQNKHDWLFANLRLTGTEFLLPGYTTDDNDDSKSSFGWVHEGFYDYLFGKTEISGISKGENLMKILKSLLETKEGYDLYFTGHSLGGAVSTLMTFRAAAFDDFKGSRIINVSFASPYVGNQEFREQFQILEKEKGVQHLRVSAYSDLIPLSPNIIFKPMMMLKHVGVQVLLYKSKQEGVQAKDPYITYPNGRFLTELWNGFTWNVLRRFNLFNHMASEYIKRLASSKLHLEGMKLSNLYANKELTGWTKDEHNEL